MEGWRGAWNKEKATGCQLGMVCSTCGGASISTCSCAMDKFRRQWELEHGHHSEPTTARLVSQKRTRIYQDNSSVTFNDIFNRFVKCLLNVETDHEALVQRVKSATSLQEVLDALQILEEQLKK